jgi:hypothetical protein
MTGYDANSTFQNDKFTGVDVVVRPNQYEAGRAFVTVWNWDGATALNIDLSKVLQTGDSFVVHHVFDVFGAAVASGTYNGGPVSIPQTVLTAPAPIGRGPSPTMPDNRFNVFLIRKR